MKDKEIWKGVNSEGDTVTVWISESGDYPIAFNNDNLGCGGATVIPKEAIQELRETEQKRHEEALGGK